MGQRQDIDDWVTDLVDATRSIGVERGIDLLLLLLFARGWIATRNPKLWASWSDHALSNPWGSLEELRPALAEHVELKDIADSFDEDGGQAVRQTVAALDDVPISVVPKLFEAALRQRTHRLSRGAAGSETPPELAEAMLATLPGKPGRVLDPACGTGTCLLAAHHAGASELWGIEINPWMADVARMRLKLAGADPRIGTGDALLLLPGSRVDTVLLDPPWSMRLSHEQQGELHALHGTDLIVPPNADLLWAQLAQRVVGPGGRAVVLLPAGAGWRRNVERDARAALVELALEAHLTLGQVKSDTAVVAALWVLRMNDPLVGTGVLVGDLSRLRLPEADMAEEVRRSLTAFREKGQADLPPWAGATVDRGTLQGDVLPRVLLPEPPPVRVERPSPPARLLTELRVSNVKAFGAPQRLSLAPVTLLYGQNSAGKSSILQSLLLLKQSHRSSTLRTQGQYTDAGSFQGLVHRHDPDRRLEIGLSFGAVERWLDIDVAPDPAGLRQVDLGFDSVAGALPGLGALAIGLSEHHLPLQPRDGESHREFRMDARLAATTLDILARDGLLWRASDAELDDETVASQRHSRVTSARRAAQLTAEAYDDGVPFIADGLLPGAIDELALNRLSLYGRGIDDREAGVARSHLRQLAQFVEGVAAEVRLLLDEMVYLGPLRLPPRRFYDRGTARSDSIGEGVALHLFDNRTELSAVNEWLARMGVSYELDVVPVRAGKAAVLGDTVAMVLRDQRIPDVELSPLDVGFGVSQVLPIVAELLAANERLLLIEQPEIHLHPKLQTELGDLLISATSPTANANQVLVETHSEHLLLRLQRRIREGLIPSEHVAVHYVDTAEGGGAHVQQLRLDERGAFVDPWPGGFFEESLGEILEGLD